MNDLRDYEDSVQDLSTQRTYIIRSLINWIHITIFAYWYEWLKSIILPVMTC